MSIIKRTLKRILPPGVRSDIKRVLRYASPASERSEQTFECPICSYVGSFLRLKKGRITGVRDAAICLRCGAWERHRLHAFVINRLFPDGGPAKGATLHFAPEMCLQPILKSLYERYVTADMSGIDVDVRVDMRAMQFEDETFDLVFASDVLEHIDDDASAISEVWRVLRPSGVAILPVPLVADNTVEYPEPVPTELYHVRACGLDFFDRYRKIFSRVDLITSNEAPAQYQCYIFEDRSGFPNSMSPYRPPQKGMRHLDAVPICYK